MNDPVSNTMQGHSDSVGIIISNSPILLSEVAMPIESIQPSVDANHSREDMNVFFAIGIAINIIMIIAFVIWARKEFKKHGETKK